MCVYRTCCLLGRLTNAFILNVSNTIAASSSSCSSSEVLALGHTHTHWDDIYVNIVTSHHGDASLACLYDVGDINELLASINQPTADCISFVHSHCVSFFFPGTLL